MNARIPRVWCPTCGAAPGAPCVSKSGRTQWYRIHDARYRAEDELRGGES